MSQEQFRASMKLVRLQIAVPISVLASIAANIVCALAIKPGLRECYLSTPIILLLSSAYHAYIGMEGCRGERSCADVKK